MAEKKISVPFYGITRSTDDGTCRDGECMELINARIRNGSVEPIGNPILLQTFNESYTKGFYHPLSKRYVFIKEIGGTIVSFNKDFSDIKSLSPDVSGVNDVQFIGNTLCAMTEKGIHYFLFKNGDYSYIGQKPEYKIEFYATDQKDITIVQQFDFEFTQGISPGVMDSRDVPKFLDTLESAKNKALDEFKRQGRIAEPICARAALRMYDGKHIAHSPVYVIFPEDRIYSGGLLANIEKVYSGTNGIKVTWTLKTFCIKYNISDEWMEQWNDIIIGIDVFSSTPFSIIDAETLKNEGIKISSTSPLIKVYSRDLMAEKIVQQSSLLFLSSSETGYVSEKALNIPEVSQELLGNDAYSRNILSAKSSFVYNGRLHLGNIKTLLYKGFGSELSIMLGNGSYNGNTYSKIMASVKIYVYIDTEDGEKIVLKEELMVTPLSPFFIYPDFRAKRAVIYTSTTNDNNSIIYTKLSIFLKSGNANYAYYLNYGNNQSIEPIDLRKATEISKTAFENTGITTNNEETAPNKLKVSEINNPFSFPAKTTYTPSTGEILSICSNTSALSQGQFGQFPLIVFSSDGIYAMHVGTEILYTNSSPVTRDFCSGINCATSIDNAIVFPTSQGLMLLQGTNVKNISESINGYLPSCIEDSPVISKILAIPKLTDSASAVRFDDYIKNGEIGYNYKESEIIISNKNYKYSYLYSLASGQWSKVSYSVMHFINSYPESLALTNTGNSVCNIQNGNRTVANIAIITRPVKLGTLTHKRILQSALRGIVKRSISDLYLKGEPVQLRGDVLQLFKDVGFYILGSNDAKHFALVSGKEAIKDLRDIIGKMNKSKAYKYFIFAFVGGVRTDISINYIELIADESFNNRLR